MLMLCREDHATEVDEEQESKSCTHKEYRLGD